MHTSCISPSLVLCPPHTRPLSSLPLASIPAQQALSGDTPNQFSPVYCWVILILWKWLQIVWLPRSLFFCIITHFCNPIALLAAHLMLVSCLAYSWILKTEATYSNKMLIDFQ
jgi:hypothetical protein